MVKLSGLYFYSLFFNRYFFANLFSFHVDSLIASIKKERSDLLVHVDVEGLEGIPEVMPADYLNKKVDNVEDIGQPTTACFLTTSHLDPTNW